MRQCLILQIQNLRSTRRWTIEINRLQMIYNRRYRSRIVLLTWSTIEARELFGTRDWNWGSMGKLQKREKKYLHNGKLQKIVFLQLPLVSFPPTSSSFAWLAFFSEMDSGDMTVRTIILTQWLEWINGLEVLRQLCVGERDSSILSTLLSSAFLVVALARLSCWCW